MKAAWDHIARSVFDRPDVDNLGQEELDLLIRDHPYFPVLHFLKTRMLLGREDPETEKTITRTALYFPNPHWYQHLLSGHEIMESHAEPLAELLSTPSPLEDIDEIIQSEQTLPEAEIEQEVHEKDYDDKRVFLPHDNGTHEFLHDLPAGESIFTHAAMEETPAHPEMPEQESVPVTPEPEEVHIDPEEVREISIVETVSGIGEPEMFEEIHEGRETASTEEHIMPVILAEQVSEYHDQYEEIKPEISLNAEGESRETATGVDEYMPGGIRELEHGRLEIKPEPEIPYVPEIPIEPLYTVDYFASQGIRLTSEEEEKGELSAKLRSFTDWLKSMKKLHPERLGQNMGLEEENTIRENAEHSNTQGEIYTEALAEVYLQQGLRHKAVAVYQKLSLLDPSKSAYFAAKIRDIKAF